MVSRFWTGWKPVLPSADAGQSFRRADEELSLADGNRGAQFVFVLGHGHGVKQLELAAPSLNDKDLPGEVHNVDLAIGGRGRRLKDVFALEIARPDEVAGGFNAKQLFLVPVEHIKLSLVKERSGHIARKLPGLERAGGLGGIFGGLHEALPGQRRVGEVALAT